MPPEEVELHPDTVIDISHESLMRVWKRLDRWADEEADAARMYQRLAETSELYKQQNAGLLRDPDLRVALKWQRKTNPTPFGPINTIQISKALCCFSSKARSQM